MQQSALLPRSQARCLGGSTTTRQPLMMPVRSPRAVCGGRRPTVAVVAQAGAAAAPVPVQQGFTTPLGFFPSAYDNIARKEYRTVYDFESWLKHRSPWRYFMRMVLWHKSYTLKNVAPALVWVSAVSAGIGAYMAAVTQGLLQGWPSLVPNAACSAFIANTTIALSVLLVFRTNASYARWDEARKMWGGLLNRSRDLIRQTVSYLPDQQQSVKEAIARWILAYARLLRVHFQPEVTYDEAVRNVLRPEEIAYLKDAPHKPLRSVHVLSQVLMSADISVIQRQEMSQNLTFYHDVLGGCERLLRAPIPTSYTRHTSKFLMLWLTVLPFALFPTCGWATIPVSAGIAAALCGIEEIGVQCEEPFGILPLSVLGDRIEDAVKDALGQDQNVKGLVNKMLGADAKPAAASSNGSAVSNGNGSAANVTAFATA